MANCLTAGISLGCSTSCSGGVSRFWLTSIDAITSITETAGLITAITMDAAEVFYEFVPYQETATFVENIDRINCNSAGTDTLTAVFPCRSQTTREALEELLDCCCGLVVIHEETNGQRWLWGSTKAINTAQTKVGFPAQLTNVNGVSGAAITDQNQTTITVEAKVTFQALPVDSALVIAV
jgi:hypothetical protein